MPYFLRWVLVALALVGLIGVVYLTPISVFFSLKCYFGLAAIINLVVVPWRFFVPLPAPANS